MAFHLTQGTFSFLPELSDDEIGLQVRYCLDHDWPINVEFTDDPHPRNKYCEMWGLPMFDEGERFSWSHLPKPAKPTQPRF